MPPRHLGGASDSLRRLAAETLPGNGWHEPDESRGSRPDLWGTGGATPPVYPAQEAVTQEIEACPAKHLAFQHLKAYNMPCDRAGTPRQSDASFAGRIVLMQARSEALEGLQRTAHRALEPGSEALRLPLADQGGKILRQVNGLGDLGMVRVELGELLGLGLRALRRTPQHKPGGPAGCQGLARRLRHTRQGLPGTAVRGGQALRLA